MVATSNRFCTFSDINTFRDVSNTYCIFSGSPTDKVCYALRKPGWRLKCFATILLPENFVKDRNNSILQPSDKQTIAAVTLFKV